MKTVYTTQWAFTRGILEIVEHERAVSGYRNLRWPNGFPLWGNAKCVFDTLEAALVDAEKKRCAKIASLERSLTRLHDMKIEVPRKKVEE